MNLSDSLPIQFWDINDQTFNEKQVCGIIKQECFCQPVQCTDEITIQYNDHVQGALHVCKKNADLSDYSNLVLPLYGYGVAWTIGDVISITNLTSTSKAAYTSFYFILGHTYTFTIDVTLSGFTGATFTVYSLDSSNAIVETIYTTSVSHTGTISFTPKVAGGVKLAFLFQNEFSADPDYGPASCTINQFDNGDNQTVIYTTTFSNQYSDVWQLTFTPSSLGLNCNQQVQFVIATADLVNGDFATGSKSPWYDPGGDAFTVSANKLTYSGASTAYINQNYAFKKNVVYTLSFDVTTSGNNCGFDIWLTNGVTNYHLPTGQTLLSYTLPPGATVYNGKYYVTFSPPSDAFTTLSFRCLNVGVRNVTVDNFVLSYTDLAQSDCIDIRDTQDCTFLIQYENSEDFDGIAYETISPGPTMYARFPAVFFEEKNPQEQEDLELSNGQIVTIRSSIQEKRLFETGFMPNYMHRKLQKVLMHETIYIDGDYWKKRDSYDDSPIKKYNLKRASVWLTKYDSVEKNTI